MEIFHKMPIQDLKFDMSSMLSIAWPWKHYPHISLKGLTTENVEARNIIAYYIDAHQYEKPLPLLRNNRVHALQPPFCQNPPSSIPSRLHPRFVTNSNVLCLISTLQHGFQILIKNWNILGTQTLRSSSIQSLWYPKRKLWMPLVKPTKPTRSRNSILEWSITQLSGLCLLNFQLSETHWMPIHCHTMNILYNFLFLSCW